MKKVRMLILPALLLATMAFFTACGGNGAPTATEETQRHEDGAMGDHAHPHGEGANYTSAYVCPMHCEGSGSDEPGNCPVCGMTYQAMEEHVADGHMHE